MTQFSLFPNYSNEEIKRVDMLQFSLFPEYSNGEIKRQTRPKHQLNGNIGIRIKDMTKNDFQQKYKDLINNFSIEYLFLNHDDLFEDYALLIKNFVIDDEILVKGPYTSKESWKVQNIIDRTNFLEEWESNYIVKPIAIITSNDEKFIVYPNVIKNCISFETLFKVDETNIPRKNVGKYNKEKLPVYKNRVIVKNAKSFKNFMSEQQKVN
ncbi:unnamed protein product [marine sediment metagenome]|uniref:Uncharacterized protein n=1 Tax=marine sediment metagenome TaxID=412755 RepID=X1C2R1_9ZZZZ